LSVSWRAKKKPWLRLPLFSCSKKLEKLSEDEDDDTDEENED
jgi:hypothetical protein